MDARIAEWMAHYSVVVARVALGVIFLWFGVLKFFPGLSDAAPLAGRTMSALTLGFVPPQVAVPILAVWECAIGLGFLTGLFMRATILLLVLQLPGTFVPLVLFPAETWKQWPYAPTLEGHYIIKNLVIIAAGLLVGATVRGGDASSPTPRRRKTPSESRRSTADKSDAPDGGHRKSRTTLPIYNY